MKEEMQILTLWQPWASAISLGLKQYETRSWSTRYRGKLAIHAAKRLIDQDGLDLIFELEEMTGKPLNPVDFKYPRGCIVAIADLTACPKMRVKGKTNPQYYEALLMGDSPDNVFIEDQTALEETLGYWSESRYAWKLENIIALPEPIPHKGGQGLRRLADENILDQLDTLTRK